MVFAPKSNISYKTDRKKKIVKTRPLPDSEILNFEKNLIRYPWDEIFMNKTVDEQVELFHDFLRSNLEKYFPENVQKFQPWIKSGWAPSWNNCTGQCKENFTSTEKVKSTGNSNQNSRS